MSTRAALVISLLAGCGDSRTDITSNVDDATQSRLGGSPVAWFAPNVGARDTLQLFTDPDAWAGARARTSVFKLYAINVLADDGSTCPRCGANVYPGFVQAQAFSRLQALGVDVAVEAGAVKHHTCDGATMADSAAAAAERIHSAQGQLRYVAMDEPFIGGEQVVNGQSCHFTMAQSADQTARFISHLRDVAPSVEVGDIEPYPAKSAAQLEAWVDALRDRGVTLAFFHLDIDRNDLKNRHLDPNPDLRALHAFTSARGIPFGITFNAHELEDPSGSDSGYYDTVLKWVTDVRQNAGVPEVAIFQSWFDNGTNTVPNNLPLAGRGFTRALLDGATQLGVPARTPTPDPQPNPSPPPSGPAADAAIIKVTHLYPGVLQRPVDPSGLASVSALLRQGQTSSAVCAIVFASTEYAANHGSDSAEDVARALYQGILERDPEPAGLAACAADIRLGHRAQQCGGILDSDEFRQRFLE